MNTKEISSKLRKILNREDVEENDLLNRSKSSKHENEITVLIEHISLLISYLKFDAEASRRELFVARKLLEQEE